MTTRARASGPALSFAFIPYLVITTPGHEFRGLSGVQLLLPLKHHDVFAHDETDAAGGAYRVIPPWDGA